MESFQILTKFLKATNRPGLPTVALVSESQTPFTNG